MYTPYQVLFESHEEASCQYCHLMHPNVLNLHQSETYHIHCLLHESNWKCVSLMLWLFTHKTTEAWHWPLALHHLCFCYLCCHWWYWELWPPGILVTWPRLWPHSHFRWTLWWLQQGLWARIIIFYLYVSYNSFIYPLMSWLTHLVTLLEREEILSNRN